MWTQTMCVNALWENKLTTFLGWINACTGCYLVPKYAIWQHHCLTHVAIPYLEKYFIFFPWVLDFFFFFTLFHCLACSQKFLAKGASLRKFYFCLCSQDHNLGIFNIHMIVMAILLISSIALFIPVFKKKKNSVSSISCITMLLQ